jgi:hypothetical protein
VVARSPAWCSSGAGAALELETTATATVLATDNGKINKYTTSQPAERGACEQPGTTYRREWRKKKNQAVSREGMRAAWQRLSPGMNGGHICIESMRIYMEAAPGFSATAAARSTIRRASTPVGACIQHAPYTQSSILRNDNLRNHWWGGARKRINQKGSEPGNAIISGDFP